MKGLWDKGNSSPHKSGFGMTGRYSYTNPHQSPLKVSVKKIEKNGRLELD
ncbi:hypothetical protein ACX8XP_00680 [Calditrichota bacterium LG25]